MIGPIVAISGMWILVGSVSPNFRTARLKISPHIETQVLRIGTRKILEARVRLPDGVTQDVEDDVLYEAVRASPGATATVEYNDNTDDVQNVTFGGHKYFEGGTRGGTLEGSLSILGGLLAAAWGFRARRRRAAAAG